MKTNATIGALLLGLFISVQAFAETSPEATLDTFYQAGAEGDRTEFVAMLAQDAVVLGMDDATRLQGQALRDFVSESFASGKTWSYTSSDREIRLSADGAVAWFDESLHHEQLGRGRASGVLVQTGGIWKIVQYNLSVPLSGSAQASPSGTSGAAATTVRTDASQQPECRQLRHKTLKKSTC